MKIKIENKWKLIAIISLVALIGLTFYIVLPMARDYYIKIGMQNAYKNLEEELKIRGGPRQVIGTKMICDLVEE